MLNELVTGVNFMMGMLGGGMGALLVLLAMRKYQERRKAVDDLERARRINAAVTAAYKYFYKGGGFLPDPNEWGRLHAVITRAMADDATYLTRFELADQAAQALLRAVAVEKVEGERQWLLKRVQEIFGYQHRVLAEAKTRGTREQLIDKGLDDMEKLNVKPD